MCGIAGIYHPNKKVDNQFLKDSILKMCAVQRKRGPDDVGVWTNGKIGLGCARLQITGDQKQGKQPLQDAWGNRFVFNGEIYDRSVEGSNFTPTNQQSDGLVLAAALNTSGFKNLQKLSGMYAAAFYHEDRQELILLRDAVGQKPLYYRKINGGIIFASTINAILQISPLPVIREQALYEYLIYKSVGGYQSIFEEINQLPPGSWMKVNKHGEISQGKWWNLPELNLKDRQFRLRETLEQSVQKRVNYDAKIGVFLSGGFDSGIVGALAKKHKDPAQIQYLSVGYDIKEVEDETPFAIQLAQYLNVNHEVLQLKSEDIPTLFQASSIITEDPIQDPVVLPSILLAQHAATFTKVILTGDGSDELWGGYSRFDHFQGSIYDYLPSTTVFQPNELGLKKYPSSYLNELDLPDDQLPALDQIFRLEISNRMRNYHLSRIDKIIMDAGVEARCPFLDIHMLNLGLEIPAQIKRPNGLPKGLLINAFTDMLPSWLINRKKQPFSLPIRQWLCGPLKPYAMDVLSNPNSFVKGFLSTTHYLEKLNQNLDSKSAAKIWSLLQLESWYEAFYTNRQAIYHESKF